MHKIYKKIIWLFLGCALVILVYNMVYLRPKLDQIKENLRVIDNQNSHPPQLICDLVQANDSEYYTVRLIAYTMYPKNGQMQQHINEALLSLFIKLHFNQHERCAIFATLVEDDGQLQGLSASAQSFFGKSLNQLSQYEAAIVVANTFAPSYFNNHPEKLKMRARELLTYLENKEFQYKNNLSNY